MKRKLLSLLIALALVLTMVPMGVLAADAADADVTVSAAADDSALTEEVPAETQQTQDVLTDEPSVDETQTNGASDEPPADDTQTNGASDEPSAEPEDETATLQSDEAVLESILYGDANKDGEVSVKDVLTIQRSIVGGYDIPVYDAAAADVDLSGTVNATDVILIRRYIVGGYNVVLGPGDDPAPTGPSPVTITSIEEVSGTVVLEWKSVSGVDGYRVYRKTGSGSWTTVLSSTTATTFTDTAVTAGTKYTYTIRSFKGSTYSTGYNDTAKSITVVEVDANSHKITYDIANGDTYIEGLVTEGSLSNPNGNYYSEASGLTLDPISLPGYKFLGWYDGAGGNADQVKKIAAGSTDDIHLYAHWEKIPYTVQFQSDIFLDTPSEATYTVDKGLALPTPKYHNYTFTGWSDEKGKLFTGKKIPAGTTGNLTLQANWTSERNKTYTRPDIETQTPIYVEDEENNQLLMIYEIGEIQNVPINTIEKFGYINKGGVSKTATKTYSVTTTAEEATSLAKSIANSTTNSTNWTLSKNWNEVTSVNQEWQKESGMTREEIEQKCKTEESNWLISNSKSGSTDTSHMEKNANSWSNDTKITSSNENYNQLKTCASVDAEVGVGYGPISAKVGSHISADTETVNTNKHGFETGSARSGSSLVTDSAKTTAGWSNSASYGGSVQNSVSNTTATTVSQKVSETYGIGQSYLNGGEESQGIVTSNTSSTNDEYVATVTYGKIVTDTKTETWTTENADSGYHRWVLTSKARVFGVVGYDMATESFFVNTFTVISDDPNDISEFEDFSVSTNEFNDHENGVISFEVPYEAVTEYVADRTAYSEGLKVDQTTGTITGYTGTDNCVVIPEYYNVGNGKVVKITGISSTAFQGNTDILCVVLSDFITEIPKSAFEGCTSLEGITGGSIKKIGSCAFYGCTSLAECAIDTNVTSLGSDAFYGVGRLYAEIENGGMLLPIAFSGADEIVLYLGSVSGGEDALNDRLLTAWSSTKYLEVNGGNRTFKNLTISSGAGKTVIKNLTLKGRGQNLWTNSPVIEFENVSVSADGIAAVFEADNTEIGLQGNLSLTSKNTSALLCKNVKLYETNPKVDGKLAVAGKVSVCGSIDEGDAQMTYSAIEKIDSDTFDKMKKGCTVTFDPNGGSLTGSDTRVGCRYGAGIGKLLTATRDSYDFVGWYTKASGGDRVTEETPVTSDMTVYAHWSSKVIKEAKKANVPAGAEILSTYYTYDLTSKTESKNDKLDGWTKDETKRTGWGGTQGPVYYDPQNGSRNVWSEQYETGRTTHYKYYHRYGWGYNVSTGSNGYVWSTDAWMTNGARHTIDLTYPLEVYQYNWAGSGETAYKGYACEHDSQSFVWFSDGTYDDVRYGTRWYYQEPVYTYYFKKTESLRSDSYPTVTDSSKESISNVVEWARYREK